MKQLFSFAWVRNVVALALALGSGGRVLAQGFGPVTTYAAGTASEPLGLALGDLNGDAHLDLVTANAKDGTVGVWLGVGDGTLGGVFFYPTGIPGASFALKLGDLNHDGHLDLVLATNSLVGIRLGKGDGTFGPPATYPAMMSEDTRSLALGDVNADGQLDIITVANASGQALILLGKRDGTFAPAVVYPIGGQPQAVALGDVNGDGAIDIAATNTSQNSAGCLLGKGDGTFGPVITYTTPPSQSTFAIGLALGDVNNDGKPDLLTSSFTGTIDVLLGSGDGKFTLGGTYVAGTTPVDLQLSDLNGDGSLDAITADFGSGTLTVLPGMGDGSFGTAMSYAVGTSNSGTVGVVLGDLNGDSIPDLAQTNANDGTIGILLNQAPVFTLSGPLVGSAGTSIMLAGSRLAGATKVTFVSSTRVATTVPASSFTSTNYTATPNTIGLRVPTGLAAGSYTVAVTTSVGTTPKVNFTVSAPLAAASGQALDGFGAFPNPAHTTVMVQVPAVVGASQVSLCLRDALGRAVRMQTTPLPAAGLQQALDLRGLAPGLYLLQVQAGSSYSTHHLLLN